MATDHQHRDDHRDVSDGLRDPEYPERETQAIQLKLDELIRAVDAARTELVDLEDLPDDELLQLQRQFADLRRAARVQ